MGTTICFKVFKVPSQLLGAVLKLIGKTSHNERIRLGLSEDESDSCVMLYDIYKNVQMNEILLSSYVETAFTHTPKYPDKDSPLWDTTEHWSDIIIECASVIEELEPHQKCKILDKIDRTSLDLVIKICEAIRKECKRKKEKKPKGGLVP